MAACSTLITFALGARHIRDGPGLRCDDDSCMSQGQTSYIKPRSSLMRILCDPYPIRIEGVWTMAHMTYEVPSLERPKHSRGKASFSWVAVEEPHLSYHNQEIILFTTYP